jgi:hypothetical protein
MDDRIRVSDAERDHVAARLRENFAEGRLTRAEFDERVSGALRAKTVGELRVVLADLPGPVVPPLTRLPAPVSWTAPLSGVRARPASGLPRRLPARPRLLPLAILALAAALLVPGAGWLLFAVTQLLLLVFLVACLAAIVVTGRFARRLRGGPPWGSVQRWPSGPRW